MPYLLLWPLMRIILPFQPVLSQVLQRNWFYCWFIPASGVATVEGVKLITCFHDSWIYEFFYEIFFVLCFYKVKVFYWELKMPNYNLSIITQKETLLPSDKCNIKFREKHVMNSLLVMESVVEKYVKFFRSTFHRNNYYFAKYICCEILNFLMLFFNFYLTNVFLRTGTFRV